MTFFFFVAAHIYVSLALRTIANKTLTPHAWIAWLPGLNVFIMPILIAGKPLSWTLLPAFNVLLAPAIIVKKPWSWIPLALFLILNGYMGMQIWMKIAEKTGKPTWFAFLLLIPLVNVIVLGAFAWME